MMYKSFVPVLCCTLLVLYLWAPFSSPNGNSNPNHGLINLAAEARITGPGEETLNGLIDGVIKKPTGEWIGGSRNLPWGEIDYPKISLQWEQPRKINKVVVYDRVSPHEHMAACTLTFDDGSKIYVNAIPNDGNGKTIVFEEKLTKSLRLSGVDGAGRNIGLAELEAFFDPSAKPNPPVKKELIDLVSRVDPTIETGRGRWFFCTPGSRPFGMVAAAAYTSNKNQMGGGYNYNRMEIRGFAQVHGWIMSGINIMPTIGKVNPNMGEIFWKSKYSHQNEIIEPGYHKVYLERYKTGVEYTSTDRASFYRLTYDQKSEANLLLSLGSFLGSVSCVDGKAKLVGDRRIEGSIGTTDRFWGGPKLARVFYVMELDRPVKRMDGWKGPREKLHDIKDFHNSLKAGRIDTRKENSLSPKWRRYLFRNRPEEQAGVSLVYDVEKGDEVLVKIGISFTSVENARRNLKEECDHWDFDRVRQDSRNQWNQWLGRMTVAGGTDEQQIKFYTDLWHVLLGRHKIDDISGDYPSYMGEDGPAGYPELEIKTVPTNEQGESAFHMYNSDALWLMRWNLNVLWGLGWPELMDEFSASLIEYANVGGRLPRGPCSGGYSNIMTGNPATSLITAAWQKNLMTHVDANHAYKVMRNSQREMSGDGTNVGIEVQTAFEYWALAQMAKEMGETSDLPAFQKEIDDWKKFYDDQQKLLMAPGSDDPLSGKGWVEANSWQGTFGLAHDIPTLAAKMGGNEALAKKLNHAFEMATPNDFVSSYKKGYVSYANQPGCANAHIFNLVDHPWLSQYWVRRVNEQAYGGTNPNIGYGGHDEDQGQMGGVSALMSIGLFSAKGTCSKDPVYEITSPVFDEVVIKLNPEYYPGKEFRIKAHDNSRENMYIQKATLNGKELNQCWFYHREFANGGVLELWMGPEPNKSWGIGKQN